jgi:GxxExxY protein
MEREYWNDPQIAQICADCSMPRLVFLFCGKLQYLMPMTIDPFEASAQIRDPQTYQIIGAAMEVHRVLGRGFLEPVYRQALRIEFVARSIPFSAESELLIQYKGQELDCKYRADFICFGEVLVEIKAISQITGVERAQVINYLKATGFRRALLLNFGADSLQYERVVLSR